MSDQYLLQNMIEKAAGDLPDNTAVALSGSIEYTYAQFFNAVKSISKKIHDLGIKESDKIAILGDNSPHWPIAYFAINRVGAVAVPILPDFSADEISSILEQSSAKALFVSGSMTAKAEACRQKDKDLLCLSLSDFTQIGPDFKISGKLTGISGNGNEDHHIPKDEDSLASLIFTSGTTGHSKGVMLSEKNLVWNAKASANITNIRPGDSFLSILPLSHTYEFTIGLLVPFVSGASVHYLDGPPVPRLLLPVLKKVRPQFMLSVPLLIEKIYRQSIKPKFSKNNLAGKLYKKAVFRKILNKLAGKKLMATFGKRLRFFGLGGAPLSMEVESFLREARFPYAIGYGLTETSPLIAGSDAFKTRFRAIGPVIKGLEVKIEPAKDGFEFGEILARGPSVMLGYYNNPEETEKVIDSEAWFHTGDLGEFDQNRNLYIKGRSKNMILGPSGENIYPEAIEELLNTADFVEESLVIQQDGNNLVAFVQINYDRLKEYMQSVKGEISNIHESAQETLKKLKADVNRKLAAFSRISAVIEQVEPFIKTPTKKIKRYLYEKIGKKNLASEN